MRVALVAGVEARKGDESEETQRGNKGGKENRGRKRRVEAETMQEPYSYPIWRAQTGRKFLRGEWGANIVVKDNQQTRKQTCRRCQNRGGSRRLRLAPPVRQEQETVAVHNLKQLWENKPSTHGINENRSDQAHGQKKKQQRQGTT